jgi:hypothetical protein
VVLKFCVVSQVFTVFILEELRNCQATAIVVVRKVRPVHTQLADVT